MYIERGSVCDFFFLLKSCYYVKSTPSESNGYVSRVLTAGSQGAGTVF